MKVGLMLPTMQSMELNEAMMQAASALRVDSLWVPDHLLGVAHPATWAEYPSSAAIPDPDAFLDPFCVAAALGRQTDLMFGTCVTDGTRRRGGDLARTVLTLNNGCRGGFVLGIGAGEAESLLPFGYDFSRPVGRLEETLKDLRSLFDTGRMPGDGIGRTGLPLSGPHGKPQIWMAGARARSLELAGRDADGWMPVGLTAEEYAQNLAYLNQVAASVGRPRLTGSMFPLTLLGDSREHIIATLEKYPLVKLGTLYAPAALWAKYGLEHPSGPNCRGTADAIPHAIAPDQLRRLAREMPLEMVEEFIYVGNAEEIAARLKPFADAGLEHIVPADFTGMAYPPDEAGRLLMTETARLTKLLQAMPVGRPEDFGKN